MKSSSTKHYSSRQEKMIAEYLGWKVVSGSGSRPFNPGDVRSDRFLGECKTFTKESDTVYCYHSVWSKICDEAKAVMKQPVLFVDNGTQLAKNTWCVIRRDFAVSNPELYIADPCPSIHTANTRIRFSHREIQSEFKKFYPVYYDYMGIPFVLNNMDVILLKLETLKYLIEGD